MCVSKKNCACVFILYSSNNYKVVLGVHSLSQAEDTKQTFDIDAVYNHPDFDIENYDNDIALIKVKNTNSGNK